MSRSYRTIADGPFISDRQRMHEEQKRQALIDSIRQDSAYLRKINNERAELRAMGCILHGLLTGTERLLNRLEDQRDRNTPKSFDEPWNEAFCEAVRLIPDVKRLCNDLNFAWLNIDRKQFLKWM